MLNVSQNQICILYGDVWLTHHTLVCVEFRMGEKEVPLFKYMFYVGGNFTSMPFMYEGGRVEVYESL